MANTLEVGSVIEDRYELVEELGEGGFARVFAARQVHLDRLVAIKVLNISLDAQSDDEFERRFLHEAKMAAQISHPNAVTIHEFGFSGPLKQPYIAMEMLQGHDLDEELCDGPMLPSRALRLLLPVLDALAAGHAKQIVHKDLKPANLFICNPSLSSELMVVLDYGVARWNLESSPKFTATGAFTGTPAYLAPEYARSQVVTPAVDVYQMGLIIPEMLTGLPLVMEETPWDCLMVHTEGRVEVPDVVRNSALGPVIEKALAYDYRERLPDASALRMELEKIDGEALDDHFREGGIGTLAAKTLQDEVPGGRSALSDQTHRSYVGGTQIGGTNAAWPPQQDEEPPTQPSEFVQPFPDEQQRDGSPGTVLIPAAGRGPGGVPEPKQPNKPEKDSPSPPPEEVETAARDRSPERRNIGLIAGAVAVGLIAATAVSIWVMRGDTRTESTNGNASRTATYEAEIDSEPDTAIVLLDGERVGTTPMVVNWTGDAEKTVTLRLDGFVDEDVAIRDGSTHSVYLKPAAEVATKTAAEESRPKPKPKSRPKPKPKPKPEPGSDDDESERDEKAPGVIIAD